MLKPNALLRALAEGRAVHGLLNAMPCALMVEMAGYAGYDFVILDMEHTCVNPESIEHMVRAAECAGMVPLVRVPGPDEGAILRALDAGAMGVVVPRVSSRSDAELAVAASRYHPLGRRGVSGGRTTGFGSLPLADYMAQANREILVVAMIEDRQGVDAIDAIVSVAGIGMVLEGAMDLSQSLGVPAQAQHSRVQDAIATVAAACRRHGVPFCAMPRQAGQYAMWRQRGVQAFLLGDDRGIAFRALKAHRELSVAGAA